MVQIGGGKWSPDDYITRTAHKVSTVGTSFDYDVAVKATPVSKRKVHDTLDVKSVNKKGPYADRNVRESCDSDDHPESEAFAVFFDVTGSMHKIPRILQAKLPQLYSLLLLKGYSEHPQIMFGAIGDHYSDQFPVQLGQFESDNRADENLEAIILEGGGGGTMEESYELTMLFMARNTALDCHTKRGEKGILFLIGDEKCYSSVSKADAKEYLDIELDQDISIEQIVAELKEKWEVFFLHARSGSYGANAESRIHPFWVKLLGEDRVIWLQEIEAISETIGLLIGMTKGTIDLDTGLDDLKDVGVDEALRESVSQSLALVGATSGAAVATASGSLPATDDDEVTDL